ncbi:receptor-type tyrosine-protein phosphatase alpha [Sinocyclocheilus grahami]|uniref:receptor-type tyrosine-protein phosphatase alpha n=1 Tax=Sinocyclocheilus grahami TaxID=75366 RepID=UPI0007ACB27C|nr:PREDICTED: receptor-type tyrosine-protein phosphatase alpha-like [Sinocyclocheilus grahami]
MQVSFLQGSMGVCPLLLLLHVAFVALSTAQTLPDPSGAVLTAKPTHPPPTSPAIVTQSPPSITPSAAPSPELVVTTGLNDSAGVVTPEVPTAPPVVAPPIVAVPTEAPPAPPTPSAASPSLTTVKTTVLATAEPPKPDPTPTQSTSEPETDTPSAPTDATTADISKPPDDDGQVQGYQEKNKFIAAQGPKEETVNDFWRMIWEQNTATIVMVTNLKERKECKCAQYWPDQGCWTYGNIRVSVEDMMVLVDYTIRKFCIQQVGDVSGKKPQRLVTQFHFTSWPDFGVPFTPIGMLKFLKKVKTYNPQYAGPIVVHCSAGVGRTGTFIVIDAMLDMMGAERKVDVFGFVTRIRAQRCQMVQTDMQYVFIFQALLEHYLYGDTELEVTSLESHLNKLYAPLPGAGCGGLEAEFKKLTSIKIQNDKMRTGNLPANMKKNRVLQIIPYEFNRVIIPVKRGEENTDYINASFIDGYRQKDSYMACQGPLQHTIEDFWRMIWEWRSCSIVTLTELEERGQEKCAQYWSSDGVMVCGDMSIELKREEESESYTVRDLLVTNNRENKSRAVRQFHFHGWPEVGIPSDGKGMINIIAAVQKQQQQSGNHPITVHCSAGAGRTGTFCALSTVLERVKAEGILDVFQTVKSLRLQRPHMVQTLEQYEFCYKVVQEYIDAFSDYANFK